MDTFVVKSLEHAKLLTDPFKLQLLEQFAGAPVTTKQVADKMGEKAPRLYRHVDAMVDAGFLELVEERPKRGTVERYFRTVAERFEVDPELFSTSGGGSDEGLEMMRGLIRDTETELAELLSRKDESAQGIDDAILMRLSVCGSDEEIRRLREKLEEWLEECGRVAGSGGERDDDVTYSGLLAFYPRPGRQRDQ